MAVSPTERQYILSQVNKLAEEQLAALWAQAATLSDIDFGAFIKQAFPDLVDPYAAMAGDLAATWYDDTESPLAYTAVPAALPDAAKLAGSVDWALGAKGADALQRLQGTAQRAVFDTARDTIIFNSEYETGSRWVRYASANACAFCALLSTRNKVYASKQSATRVVGRGKDFSSNFNPDGSRRAGGQAKGVKTRGSRGVGEKYHDGCHCVAVEIRPGGSYEPPAHVQDFERAYKEAFDAVPNGMAYDKNNSVLKAVLSNMRSDLGSH